MALGSFELCASAAEWLLFYHLTDISSLFYFYLLPSKLLLPTALLRSSYAVDIYHFPLIKLCMNAEMSYLYCKWLLHLFIFQPFLCVHSFHCRAFMLPSMLMQSFFHGLTSAFYCSRVLYHVHFHRIQYFLSRLYVLYTVYINYICRSIPFIIYTQMWCCLSALSNKTNRI